MASNQHNKHDMPLILRESYFNYKLAASKNKIRILMLMVGAFNLAMLLPDLQILRDPTARMVDILLRVSFSAIVFVLYFLVSKMKASHKLYIIITACEFYMIFIFLFVLYLYESPSLYIQTLGMIMIILVVFNIPNRWVYKLLVSALGAFGYAVCICFEMPDIKAPVLVATIVYMGIAIAISSISAWNSEKHQMREFESKNKLERLSTTDYLTNATNRFKLQKEADRWIHFCYSQGLPLSLVFIDVDNLKEINDKHGHLIGDSILASLVQLIHRQLRTTDTLARWGGDEFVILLPNTLLENAVVSSERIRKAIEENIFAKDVKVTCSFGIVDMKEGSVFESLIHEADHLMYEGKKKGKNNIQWTGADIQKA